jgi:diacylglycerol diphosphate phosphatase/phosphatidate phosphatase
VHALTLGSCDIDFTKVNTDKFMLQTIDICQQKNNYILQDGFKSFPSGHSSGTSACSTCEALG